MVKVYVVLTGLIALVPIDFKHERAADVMIFLMRGSAPGEAESATVPPHIPRVRFQPAETQSWFMWELTGEDFEVVGASGSQDTDIQLDLSRFADPARIQMSRGQPRNRIARGCVKDEISASCRKSAVGRFILTHGSIEPVELTEDALSLSRAPFSRAQWGFKSADFKNVRSSNHFELASAVLVRLGEFPAEDVTLQFRSWDSADVTRIALGPASPARCEALTGDGHPCVIVHVTNLVDPTYRSPHKALQLGDVDMHFKVFGDITRVWHGYVALPYLKMNASSAGEGAGSPPSGRCIPQILYEER